MVKRKLSFTACMAKAGTQVDLPQVSLILITSLMGEKFAGNDILWFVVL